jgi:endoplasmic reticulum chaperone BiP
VRGVREEEAVVHVAIVLAGILSGQVEDGAGEMCIMPLTYLSLGMETAGGVMHRIFPRNSIYLAKKWQVGSTLHAGQTELTSESSRENASSRRITTFLVSSS